MLVEDAGSALGKDQNLDTFLGVFLSNGKKNLEHTFPLI